MPHPANALFHALKKIADDQEAEEREWYRQQREKLVKRMREEARGRYVEGNEFDGDGGREHSDYMNDNGRRS